IETLENLMSFGIDGLISFMHRSSDESILGFADRFGPLLLINREYDQLPDHLNLTRLCVDHKKGAMLAVQHLIELGHKHIAKLGHDSRNDLPPLQATGRTLGYWEALDQAGIDRDPKILVSREETLEGGYEGAKYILTYYPDVTAIFAYNDLMALGALKACQDLNISVPNDISIVGYDDIKFSSMVTPALTTVSLDKYKMGQAAFRRVHNLIEDRNSEREVIVFEPTLVVRDSTGPVRT
ncbi:MAG: substrate-binding domain-containing protein, partial [Chloroflexota bacterium]